MAEFRISRKSIDIIFKRDAEKLIAALPSYLSLDIPAIVGPLPTELPVVDIHMEQPDILYAAEDDSIVHLEVQTTYEPDDPPRFLVYDALLYRRTRKQIYTIVIYGAGIEDAEDEIRSGTAIHYRVHNVFLGRKDGDAVLGRIRAAAASGETLTDEDQLDLVLQILMGHEIPRQQAISDAIMIAKQLPPAPQRQTLAALLGVGSRFLKGDELARLVEDLMSTPTGLELLERRYQEGRQEGLREGRQEGLVRGQQQGIELGMAQARRNDIQAVLTSRFGKTPATLGRRLNKITDMRQLDALFGLALTSPTLKDFTSALGS